MSYSFVFLKKHTYFDGSSDVNQNIRWKSQSHNKTEGKHDNKNIIVVVFSTCQLSISLLSHFQRFDSNIKYQSIKPKDKSM